MTTTGWIDIEFESAGTYLKLKDKESVKGFFRGDPKHLRKHWIEGKSHLCPGKEECLNCKSGDRPRFAFVVNFITKEGDNWVCKVWEQGATVYQDLKSYVDAGYNLSQHEMKITRLGTGKDTIYKVIPNPAWKMPADLEKQLKQIPLHPLAETPPQSHAFTQEQPLSYTDEDIPF